MEGTFRGVSLSCKEGEGQGPEPTCRRVQVIYCRVRDKISRDRTCEEFKREYNRTGCGAFTALLVRGLRGNDERVTSVLRERSART